MARFRLFDPVPQWRDALGVLAAGGSLVFTDSGTTTPRNVYSADTGGVSLGNTLTLDSDARLSEDFWLDGEYRVVLKDADGATIWSRDNVRDVASDALATPDPTDGTDGQALFTDGTPGGFYWDDVLTIPSQTGNSGKFLTTDGEALSWGTLDIPDYDSDNLPGGIEATPGASGSVVIGGVMFQWGTDTAPSAGTISTSKAVTFGTAFSSTPYYCEASPNAINVTGDSPSGAPSSQAINYSSSGFTANFFVGAENNGGDTDITSSIPFKWFAVGPA